jgi:hypothetical protein
VTDGVDHGRADNPLRRHAGRGSAFIIHANEDDQLTDATNGAAAPGSPARSSRPDDVSH